MVVDYHGSSKQAGPDQRRSVAGAAYDAVLQLWTSPFKKLRLLPPHSGTCSPGTVVNVNFPGPSVGAYRDFTVGSLTVMVRSRPRLRTVRLRPMVLPPATFYSAELTRNRRILLLLRSHAGGMGCAVLPMATMQSARSTVIVAYRSGFENRFPWHVEFRLVDGSAVRQIPRRHADKTVRCTNTDMTFNFAADRQIAPWGIPAVFRAGKYGFVQAQRFRRVADHLSGSTSLHRASSRTCQFIRRLSSKVKLALAADGDRRRNAIARSWSRTCARAGCQLSRRANLRLYRINLKRF